MHNNDIFGLDIPMQQPPCMHILHGLEQTLDDEGCRLLTVGLFVFELGVELALRPQLQQDVDVVLILEEPVEVDDVRVVQVGVDLDLPGQLRQQVLFDYLLFRDYFEGCEKPCQYVSA
jgi:hypothetical protein